jgi:murein DD-endopeptidase MepM/ murein hydrolase activator NlpD
MVTLSKSLMYPVAGNKSRVKDLWGASRAGGIRRHKGIDIHARRGTPVVAIADGIIVEKAHTPIGGKTLWLRSSAHGWKAYYAHLDKQYVREGQYVRKGQIIGTLGNTGNARSTPPHLHFGISGSNGWVNPYPYVRNSPKVAIPKAKKKTSSTKKKTFSKRRTVKKR